MTAVRKTKKASLTSKGSSTRERIVEAARKQLVEQGYEAFVMRELADSLGIKLGNLQYYFKTKEALIIHLFEREAARDLDAIGELQVGEDDPTAVFRGIVGELTQRWRGSGGILFSTLMMLSLHNKTYRQLYRSIYTNFYQALAGPLREMNPVLSDDEVQLRVRLVTALIDGSSMQIQVGPLATYLESLQRRAEEIALAPAE